MVSKREERLQQSARLRFRGSLDGRVKQARPTPSFPAGDLIENPVPFDFSASPDRGGFFNETFIVSSGGVQNLSLKYIPKIESIHVYSWGGLLPRSSWSVVNNIVTVGDAPASLIAGDQLTVEYAWVSELNLTNIVQKLYFQSSGSPSISPTFGAAWEYTSGAVRRPMSEVPTGTSLSDASATYTVNGTVDSLVVQLIGDTLPGGRIQGNFRTSVVVFGGGGSLIAARATYLQVVIRVVSSSGAEKAILYNGQAFTSTSTSSTDPNYRWEDQTNNRILSGALSTFDAVYGDRLVVELGGRECLGPGTWGHYPNVRLGDPAAADLQFLADTFTGAQRPWIEIGV